MRCQYQYSHRGRERQCLCDAADHWTTCDRHRNHGEDRGKWLRYWTSMGMGDMARRQLAS